jgi:hypothetical protein
MKRNRKQPKRKTKTSNARYKLTAKGEAAIAKK